MVDVNYSFQTIPTDGSGKSSPYSPLGDVSGLGIGTGLTQSGSGSVGAPTPISSPVTIPPSFNNSKNFSDLNVQQQAGVVNGSPGANLDPATQKDTVSTGTNNPPSDSPENWDTGSALAVGLTKGVTHNVVDDYWWTLTPKKSQDGGSSVHPARLETPRITLREFKMVRSALSRAFDFYSGVATQLGSTPGSNSDLRAKKSVSINDLYGYYSPSSKASEDLNRTYIFPYFADSYYDIQSSYSDFARQMIEGAAGVIKSGASLAGGFIGTLGGAFTGNIGAMAAGSTIGSSIGGSVGSMLMSIYALNALGAGGVENLIKAVTQAPRAGFVDQPMTWNTSVQKTFNVTFPLFNNYGNDSFKNWKLIWELTYASSFNKATAITSEPPYFYEVSIPNQYYTPAAYVSNITVKNLGNQRVINGYIIPDAWLVSLTLVDFFVPSKNLMTQAFNGSTINAS